MYHNFGIYTSFDIHTDYNQIFGSFDGNIFARTMEECFYRNPIQEDENYYYGVSLDNIMSLPQFLTAILSTYVIATGDHPKSGMSNQFRLYENRDIHYQENDVRDEYKDGKRYVAYRNIKYDVVQAIIFGAYFLACINAELNSENKKARDFLLDYLQKDSHLDDEAFKSKHIASYLYKTHFVPTMHKIVKQIFKESQGMSTPGKRDLQFYIDHPIYGLGYDSVASYLGIVSMKDNVELTDADYINVFAEAEFCVNRVMNAMNPELEIPRVHAYINTKYYNQETKSNGLTVTVITTKYCIGCIIEMLFMIALYDLLPEKTDRVMKALINMRAFIENHDNSYIYQKDELWALVAQRIPPLPSRPRVEDLQVEIDRLKTTLGQYESGNYSTGWHDIVEMAVANFDSFMKPAGFYDIPKVKQLSRVAQCQLILKLLLDKVPFKVALLNHIGFVQYMESQKEYNTQAARLRLIEQAVGLSKDNRELKGNFNVLKEGSKEDPTKYTAYNHQKAASEFYNSLLD